MGIKYGQFLFGQTLCRTFLYPFDILFRLFKRRIELFDLDGRIAFLLYDLYLRRLELISLSDRNTGRCRNTF